MSEAIITLKCLAGTATGISLITLLHNLSCWCH